MVSQLIGNYMVKKGYLSNDKLAELLEEQSKTRVKLGLIAVAEGMLTIGQADEVNRLQQVMDKRFGDIAVEKGYLTDEQVGSLLKMQGNEYLTFAQSLVDAGIVTMEQLQTALKDFQTENGYTNTELEYIKSGDVDKIVPLFLPAGAEKYTDAVTIALKTLIRCIDSQAYPMTKGVLADRVSLAYPVTQELSGTQYWKLGFADVDASFCPIASIFAKYEFTELDEDVQDAIGEFTNCVNGLYATALSAKGISVELLPPQFGQTSQIEGKDILVMPFGICGKTVNFVITDQKEWR